MGQKLQVEGYSSLVRDTTSGAIISTNRTEYVQYMERRNRQQADKEKVNAMCDDINNLKCELTEIKSLLCKILEK